MLLGRVIGSATATVRHPSMLGWKLLIVQPLTPDGPGADGDPVLCVDNLSAGAGDAVIITSDGRGTRELLHFDNTPVRWSSLGIADG